MKKNFLKTLLILFCFSTYLQASDLESRLKKISPQLGSSFFDTLIKKGQLAEAYQLAQREDFEGSREYFIFSVEMEKFLNFNIDKMPLEVRKTLLKIADLEMELAKQNKKSQMQVIQAWHSLFLDKLVSYMRYKNSLKPKWKFSISSKTEYDSNANRAPDNVGSSNTDSSGKSDFRQSSIFSLSLKPLINHKGFNKRWSFTQLSNLIHIYQVRHEENDAILLGTESKLTRKNMTPWLKALTFNYRLQHFSLSGDDTSHNASAYFLSHRFKVDLSSKVNEYSKMGIEKYQFKSSLSWGIKDYFKQINEGLNADDFKLSLSERLTYDKNRSLTPEIEYSNYSTKSVAGSDYNYLKFKLNHSHSHQFDFWKHKLNFSEKLSYRIKDWDQKDENLFGFSVKVSTVLKKKLKGSLSLTHHIKGVNETGGGDTDADQTQIALGLNWSTP